MDFNFTQLKRLLSFTLLFALVYCLSPNSVQAQIQTFDAVADGTTGAMGTTGWVANTTSGYRWEADRGGTGSAGTGPDVDHTQGTANGTYIYVEASAPATTGDVALLEGPNQSLAAFSNPAFSFWYHKAGSAMGNLYVDVFNGSTWVEVDSIIGATHAATGDPWLQRTTSLASFSGTVRVRFRATYGTSWAGDMAIDDVNFVEQPTIEHEMSEAMLNPFGIYSWPESQWQGLTFDGEITNLGVNALTNVTMTVNIGAFSDVAMTANLAAGASANLSTTTTFMGSGVNFYSATITADATQNDTTPGNNVLTQNFHISDSIYAHADSNFTGSLGIGAGTPGTLGQNFVISATDVMTSVSFYLNGPTQGDTMSVDVYNFAGQPTTIIGGTAPFVIPSSNPGWYTLPLTCPLTLSPGTYFVGVNETDQNVTLGTTGMNYIPNTTWVIFGTNPWQPSEFYGFPVSYLLHANFGNVQGVDLGPDTQICGGNVTLDAGAGWTTTMWNTGATTQMITVGSPGTYYVDVTDGNGCSFSDTIIVASASGLNAGTNGTGDACETDQTAIDLMTLLGGTPDMGGSWSDINGSGALSGSMFTPSTAGSGTWNFNYIVSDTCGSDTATVTMTVDPTVSAGTGTDLTLCTTDGVVNLDNQLTGADAGGTWNDDNGSGGLAVNMVNPSAAGMGTWPFTYTVQGGACPDDQETVTLTINVCPNIDAAKELLFTVYPNPTDGAFKLEIPGAVGQDLTVRILTLTGQEVFSMEAFNDLGSFELNVKDLAAGAYLVKVSNGEASVQQRLIKH